MTDRPILFSPPMISALLAGTKTQTRRVIKDQSLYRETTAEQREILGEVGEVWTGFMGWQFISTAFENRGMCGKGCLPPYAVGDRLWVRETACIWGAEVFYKTNEPGVTVGLGGFGKWTPSIFMPRAASRLTLAVTDVRVQRLQEIDQRDAEAEGVDCSGPVAINCYRVLWDSLNAKRGYGWSTNPWIVAVSFTVQRGNIDQVAP